MSETIKQVLASPEVTAILTTLLSFLTANLGTLLVFAIKYIKLKVKEAKQQAINQETIQKLTAEYEQKIEAFASKIDSSLDRVESVVIKKVKEKEEVENATIEAETLAIAKAIEDTKKALLK